MKNSSLRVAAVATLLTALSPAVADEGEATPPAPAKTSGVKNPEDGGAKSPASAEASDDIYADDGYLKSDKND